MIGLTHRENYQPSDSCIGLSPEGVVFIVVPEIVLVFKFNAG